MSGEHSYRNFEAHIIVQGMQALRATFRIQSSNFRAYDGTITEKQAGQDFIQGGEGEMLGINRGSRDANDKSCLMKTCGGLKQFRTQQRDRRFEQGNILFLLETGDIR